MNPSVTLAYAASTLRAPTTAGDVSYRSGAKQDQGIMYLENCDVVMKRVADSTANERRRLRVKYIHPVWAVSVGERQRRFIGEKKTDLA
jgi:hypothetical protein